MLKRLSRIAAALAALAVLAPATVWAQGTTGTIRGKVIDANTNEPLAAVNVVVLETDGTATSMGAMTNAEGQYVIVNVPPGRYNLRASMMGYKQVLVEGFLVTVGVSAIQNFQLEPTVLDVGETVTVTAEREMIQRDVTGSVDSYTIEDMERMAVSNTTDILTLQTNTYQMSDPNDMIPGYKERGLEQVHMRGGRNAEVAFMIDGMQVTNLVFGGQAARVSPFSLSEMVVMAGGMSAEFGNAMSGVVNMVTREGGTSYDANVEIMTSEYDWWVGQTGNQDDLRDLTAVQGYVGGPIPGVDRLTFFASGSANTARDYVVKKDDIVYDVTPSTPDPDITYDEDDPYDQVGPDGRSINPMDIHSGFLGYGFDNGWDGMLNVTYKLNPSMKLNLSGQKNGVFNHPYINNWRYSTTYGLPEHIYRHWTMGTLKEGETDYEDGIIDGTGELFAENEQNYRFEDHGRAAFVWTHQVNQSSFYSLRGSYYNYYRTMRSKRFVNDDGYMSRRSYYFRDDPVWTPDDEMHEVILRYIPHSYYNESEEYNRTYGYLPWYYVAGNLGYQGTGRYYTNQKDITRTLKGDVTSQVTSHHQVKAGFLYNRLTMDMYDLQILWYDPPYRVDNRHSPYELGLYLQDKIEYDFLIVNLGMRYDAANAGEIPYWVSPRDPRHPETGEFVIDPFDPEQAPLKAGELRSQISPRLGISHPVTDQSVIYFNYGHFFQNPIYRNLYIEGTLEDAVPLIGNPNMENEKTISYEFGFKQQFTEIWALDATVWAKDTSNMVSSQFIPAYTGGILNPYSYSVFLNYDYASSKGVDLSLIKRYSNYFSGKMNYSYMTTQSNRDDPWSGYRSGDTLETQPKRPRVLGWDQPHRFSAQVSVNLPQGAGPEIAGIYPLQKVNASIIYRASAGRPYTPTTRTRSLEPNSGRRPWTFQWDLKLYRDFETFGLRYSLFADVRNLFDRENVINVFSRTGKADDPGPGATNDSDAYDRWDFYGPPRRINLGLRIFF